MSKLNNGDWMEIVRSPYSGISQGDKGQYVGDKKQDRKHYVVVKITKWFSSYVSHVLGKVETRTMAFRPDEVRPCKAPPPEELKRQLKSKPNAPQK